MPGFFYGRPILIAIGNIRDISDGIKVTSTIQNMTGTAASGTTLIENLSEMSVDDLQHLIKIAEDRLRILERRNRASRAEMAKRAKEAGLSPAEAAILFGD